MRHLWVDSGTDPDYQRANHHAIRGLYYDITNPNTTKTQLQTTAAKGYAAGVYMATTWPQYNGKTGQQIADTLYTQFQPLRVNNNLPKLQLDIEEHDPTLILQTLTRWRQHAPWQDTSWTLEPLQGGWMTPEFVQAILSLRIRVVPQTYFSDMTPVAQDQVLRDLTRRGFPEGVVSLFYDAAHLPANWDGFGFLQSRLPS